MAKSRKMPSSAAPSVVEKLHMLRSFVGNDTFSETDLSSCLRQSGYMVELAAERLMTGQYQPPRKRLKTSPPPTTVPLSSVQAPSPKVTILTPKAINLSHQSSSNGKSKATPKTTTPSRVRKLAPVTPRTPSSIARSSAVTSINSKAVPAVVVNSNDWLLCHRWISDGVCIQRHGCMDYQENLRVEDGGILRFRGSRIQGQFPKHLSQMLTPLVEAKLIKLQAQALMEERQLPTGAHVAFSLSVYLPDPTTFFAIFDQLQHTQSSTKMFFGKRSSKKPKLNMLCEAAFALLQWAKNGETYDFDTKKQDDSDSESEDQATATIELDEDASFAEEDVPAWAKMTTTPAQELEESEPPKEFKVQLRPYQRQALWWMTQREAQEEHEESSRQQLELLKELSSASSSSAQRPSSSITSAPIQCECGPVWIDAGKVPAPSVVDNGTNPDLTHPLWERRYLTNRGHDKVLCFYVQTLFGLAVASPPPPPQPCRGGILADSMGLGKTVMLLAMMQNSPGTTLIVAPLSLLAQWEEEVESKTTLSHRIYYGDKKGSPDFDEVDVVLTTYGTLQGEWVSYTRQKEERDEIQLTGLLGHVWKRVILDEAHCVKNTATMASRACCLLKAERRWVVSGTIIQNSLQDVYALLKFLKHEPWCEHSFWKAAITKEPDQTIALGRVKRLLKPIMLRRTKESVDKDGKPILTLPPVDTKTIMVQFTPAEQQFYDALHRKSLSLFEGFIEAGTASKSWLAIFSLLHRLRQTCDHVALTVKAHLDQDEWDSNISQTVEENSEEKQEGKPKGSIDEKFLGDLMSKFRSMQSSSKKKKGQAKDAPYAAKIAIMLNEAVQSKSSSLQEECAVCLENINIHNSVVTPCFHIFCKHCLVDFLRAKASVNQSKEKKDGSEGPVLRCPNGTCPSCNAEIESSKILRISELDGKIQTSYLLSSLVSPECVAIKEGDGAARHALETAVQGTSSSKLTAILQELENVWEEEPGSKILVFSQFLGFLDLIQQSLKANRISHSRLDGKLSLKERMSVLREFGTDSASSVDKNSDSKRGSVLLISMKAGGVGLNLVAARSVFIADPWWNAAVEDQCVDRIHRIGQTADKVRVRKFYVTNSLEERIVELQKRKKSVASEILCDKGEEGSKGSSARPSLDDFKILFREGVAN